MSANGSGRADHLDTLFGTISLMFVLPISLRLGNRPRRRSRGKTAGPSVDLVGDLQASEHRAKNAPDVATFGSA
jgi:hypothetical protein